VGFVAIAEFYSLMFAGRSARRHNGSPKVTALDDHICFHGRVSARIQYLARSYRNNLSHSIPRYAVQQPVIQFRTSIHGNGLTGSALNYSQKLMLVLQRLSVPRFLVKKLEVVPFGF